MVSCIEIETASLVFASLSLLSSVMASFVCIAMLVYINVLMAYIVSTEQRSVKNISQLEIAITKSSLYMNVGLAVALSFVVVTLIFGIILIKGLLSRKAHLVKAYFIYGVTMNTLSVLFAVLSIFLYDVHVGLLSLFGCFLYCLILIMIKSTYLKLSLANYNELKNKELEADKKTIA